MASNRSQRARESGQGKERLVSSGALKGEEVDEGLGDLGRRPPLKKQNWRASWEGRRAGS